MILVVDDEPGMRHMLQRTLTAAGYDVMTVEDGEAALAVLDRGVRPDAILTDFLMPHLDGNDFIARLTAMTDAPVLILSGYVDAIKEETRGLVRGILNKPMPTERLLEEIRRYAVPDREKT